MSSFTSATAKNHRRKLIDAARITPTGATFYDRPFVDVIGIEEFEKSRSSAKRPPSTPDVHSINPRALR